MIIALSGYARSGKDEAAKVLVEEFGFRQVAFADKLRDVLYQLNPVVVADAKYHGMVPPPDYDGPVYQRLQWVIEKWGWDGYKSSPFSIEVRSLLQRMGTEAGRQTLWDSIWIDAALKGIGLDEDVVISDGRFINEFEAVRNIGGEVWRIERPGVGPANDHPSELEALTYDKFALFIINDGNLEDYKETIKNAYRSSL